MKLPRDLSGRQVVQRLCRDWGYRAVNQQGSHIILQTEEPGRHRARAAQGFVTAVPRVFLDSNVLISALIGEAGSPPAARVRIKSKKTPGEVESVYRNIPTE